MSVLAGKDFLLKSGDGADPEVFTTMGGLRTSQMTIDNAAIDVTNQGSNQWKEILDGAGIRDMKISGSGQFKNDTALSTARTRCINGTLAHYQISDGVNTFTGSFKITKLERSGDYSKEQTWSVSLESSGEITIA